MLTKLKTLGNALLDGPTRRSMLYRLPEGLAPLAGSGCYLCTATIVRNEAKYIREFVAFHQLVGVDCMLIYDDGSTDELAQALEPFVRQGFVRIIAWPRFLRNRNHQFAAYQHAVAMMRGQTTWLAMIDADEFLFAPASGNLKLELQKREKYDAIGVYSRTFGTSDLEDIAPGGLVTELLTRCGAEGNLKNRTQRTIVKPERVFAIRSANTCVLKGKTHLGWDEDGREIHSTGEAGHSCAQLRINHYFTRSTRDFREKLARRYFGKSGHVGKMQAKFAEGADLNVESNLDIHAYLPQLKAALGRSGQAHSSKHKRPQTASGLTEARSIG